MNDDDDNKNKNYIYLIIILFFCITIFSCGKEKLSEVSLKTAQKDTSQIKPQNLVSLQTTQQKQTEKKYIYEGLAYRDPFEPLSGEKIAKARLGLTTDALVPPLGSLQLKGFIVDRIDKIALFSSPYGSYLLANGRLYDSQNRLVKGFSGKIIFDKEHKPQKVILITEDNEFKEFFLKEEN